MNDESPSADPVAVFGAALSLWHAVWRQAEIPPRVNLSGCYNGDDEFMRIVMRIATEFERWSCGNVYFDDLDEVWPYLLEERFGETCLFGLGGPEALLDFDAAVCVRVALCLGLTIKLADGLWLTLTR